MISTIDFRVLQDSYIVIYIGKYKCSICVRFESRIFVMANVGNNLFPNINTGTPIMHGTLYFTGIYILKQGTQTIICILVNYPYNVRRNHSKCT